MVAIVERITECEDRCR